MATIGLRDLFVAEITMENGIESFEEPERLAKAITADISVDVAEGNLYADDSVDAIIKEFTKGTIKLKVNDLEPEKVAALLGQTIDEDGVIYAGETDEPPYVALGFRAKKTGGKFRYLWLYKVKFKIPSESFETKNSSINIIAPEIEGEFIKLDKNNLWKADYTGDETDPIAVAWFTQVMERGTKQ